MFDAFITRTLASRLALDPSVFTGILPTTTFDRYTQNDLTSTFSSSYKTNAADSLDSSTVNKLDAALTGLNDGLDTHLAFDQASHCVAFDESGTDPEWLHVSKAQSERRSLSPRDDSVLVAYNSSDTTVPLSTVPLSIMPTATSTIETGRTLTEAYSLNVATSPQTVSGFVGSTVTESYYRFSLNTPSNLNVSLSTLTADADLQLIRDANGNGVVDVGDVLTGSYQPGVQPESIATRLGVDTYFIRVYQYSGNTGYALNTFATPLVLPSGYSPTYGYGLVDAKAAIASAIGQPLLAIAPAPTSNAWDLNLVNAPAAWANGYTGQGIVVAVVDTGVDVTHPDLKNNLWINLREMPVNGIDDDGNGFIDDINGWDFVDRDNMPIDLSGHGTHVAGTIAAAQNGFGVTGVAYDAKIMPIRVLGTDGGTSTDVAAGIRYAADNGANVINLSLGGSASSTITNAVQYAVQKGALVVMSAGNEGGNQPTAPANLANQLGLAVGAIDINEKLAAFSNRAGASPLNYVVAPGVDIVSATPNNTYSSYSGTSMAAPHVSGVAALVLSANPKLTPAQLATLFTVNASLQGLTV